MRVVMWWFLASHHDDASKPSGGSSFLTYASSMPRAPAHRGRRVERFTTRPTLAAATLARCRRDFREMVGVDWTASIAEPLRFDPLAYEDHQYALELLRRLSDVCIDIDGYLKNHEKSEKVGPFGATLLRGWAKRHQALLVEVRERRFLAANTSKAKPTRRQFLASRLMFEPLTVPASVRRGNWPAKGLALVSLLVGNFPEFADEDLFGGVTVAQVLDREAKAMRRVLDSEWMAQKGAEFAKRMAWMRPPSVPRVPAMLPPPDGATAKKRNRPL